MKLLTTSQEKALAKHWARQKFKKDKLGLKDPRKETTMTDLNQVPQNAEVTITDMPEFLRKLQEDGEVTVQTAADVDGQPVAAETPTVQ